MRRFDYTKMTDEEKAFAHWLAGFSSAEASFLLSTRKHQLMPRYCSLFYSITLRRDDRGILEEIQKFLECGTVRDLAQYKNNATIPNNRKPQSRFGTSSAKDVWIGLVPLFEACPIRGKKQKDFEIWKKGAELVYGIWLRSGCPKWKISDVSKFSEFDKELKEIRKFIEPKVDQVVVGSEDEWFGHWVAGAFDGDGCFKLTMSINNGLAIGKASCSLGFRADDRPILERVRKYMGCGAIYSSCSKQTKRKGFENAKPQLVFVIANVKHLARIVVPLFRKHPLRSKKRKDFEIWAKGVDFLHQIKCRSPRSSGRYTKWTETERVDFKQLHDALRIVRKYEGPEVVLPIVKPTKKFYGFLPPEQLKRVAH